jgi:hypothetical protein
VSARESASNILRAQQTGLPGQGRRSQLPLRPGRQDCHLPLEPDLTAGSNLQIGHGPATPGARHRADKPSTRVLRRVGHGRSIGRIGATELNVLSAIGKHDAPPVGIEPTTNPLEGSGFAVGRVVVKIRSPLQRSSNFTFCSAPTATGRCVCSRHCLIEGSTGLSGRSTGGPLMARDGKLSDSLGVIDAMKLRPKYQRKYEEAIAWRTPGSS